MSRAVDLAVHVIEDLASIRALEPEWRDLERRTPEATGFQSFDWCCTWIELAVRTGNAVRPRIILVREKRHLRMLWPLQIERMFGVNWARSLGQPVTQYCDMLAEPGPDRSKWRAYAETEVRSWRDVDLLLLVHVRNDSVIASAASISMQAAHVEAPFVAFEAQSFPRSSKSVRRRERRLARHGRIDVVEPDGPLARRNAARYVLDLKTEWLSARRHHWQSFGRPLSRSFLMDLAECGVLHVYLLKVGDVVAAGDLGIVGGNTYRSIVSAYDLRLAVGSPGHVLTRLLLEQANALGLRSFDFLAPQEPYKAKLATGVVGIGRLCIVRNLKGQVGVLASSYFRSWLHVFRRCRGVIVRTGRRKDKRLASARSRVLTSP